MIVLIMCANVTVCVEACQHLQMFIDGRRREFS